MTWAVNGRIGPYARSGVDANGWVWEIEQNGHVRRVLVEVSGTAWAVDVARLPDDTRAAIETKGRAQVDEILDQASPPRVITCGTFGCRVLSEDELAAAS